MERARWTDRAIVAVTALALTAASCEVRAPVESRSETIETLPDDGRGQYKRRPLSVKDGDFTLSGPYTYRNLSLFLVHGKDATEGRGFLTLQEAMEQKKVIVHETDNVQELAIENVSGEEVFVQAGDIVKGGKQDRTLAVDIVLAPASGRVPVASVCVEQGRWEQRRLESVVTFAASPSQLASKELKLAAKSAGSQSEVWKAVWR